MPFHVPTNGARISSPQEAVQIPSRSSTASVRIPSTGGEPHRRPGGHGLGWMPQNQEIDVGRCGHARTAYDQALVEYTVEHSTILGRGRVRWSHTWLGTRTWIPITIGRLGNSTAPPGVDGLNCGSGYLYTTGVRQNETFGLPYPMDTTSGTNQTDRA